MNETLYRWTFNFHKVVRQQNSCAVEDFILPYSAVYLRIQKWKNYWNRSRFANVIIKIKVARFLWPTVYVYVYYAALCVIYWWWYKHKISHEYSIVLSPYDVVGAISCCREWRVVRWLLLHITANKKNNRRWLNRWRRQFHRSSDKLL